MSNVNWCLMAVSFGLGLLLTLAFLIRRVKREVPVYGSGGRSAGLTGSAGLKKAPKVSAPDVDADVDLPTAKVPKVDLPDVDADVDVPTAKVPKVDLPDVDAPDVDLPDVSGKGAVAAAAAGVAGGAAAAKLVGSSGASAADEPYGAGSVRLAAGAAAPSGWLIKGNENSMLFHTPDSPSYKQTIAEVWFRDEATARKAGFTHWKEGRKASGAAKFAATEPELPPGPHGPGSATPNADGSGPEGWAVKGNEDSMLYHSTESSAYAVTVAEVWFRDVETAEKAGFNRWDSGKSQRGLD